jgi:hypothetical protein
VFKNSLKKGVGIAVAKIIFSLDNFEKRTALIL